MKIEKAITEVIGGPLAATIASTFALMEVAEQEIQKAKDNAPTDQETIHNAFAYLYPSPALRGKNEELYRKHAQEMIERVRTGKDTRPATDAEILCGLSEWTLENSPGQDASALYLTLATELIPAALVKDPVPDHELEGSYPGAVTELKNKLRRRLTQAGRVKT